MNSEEAQKRMWQYSYTASAMLFFLAREHLSKDGHISSSPAAQSTAAAVPQVVQLGSASKSQFFVESLPAERSTNGIRIHGENSHSVLLQVLMFPDPWLFPVVPIEDFISQLCSNIMLKAGRPSLKKIKCPQPILHLLSKEIQTMCATLSYISAEKQLHFFCSGEIGSLGGSRKRTDCCW